MIITYISMAGEMLAFLTSALFIKSLSKQGWLLLAVYLFYTCAVEFVGLFFMLTKKNNALLYNPYILISFAFYGWLLIRSMATTQKTKVFGYIGVASFCVAATLWYILNGSSRSLITGVINAEAVSLCFLVILFFYTHIQNPVKYNALTENPAFWIASGLLIFYSGIFIRTVLYDYFSKVRPIIFGVPVHNFIAYVLSIFLYSFIIIAIVKCRYQRKIL